MIRNARESTSVSLIKWENEVRLFLNEEVERKHREEKQEREREGEREAQRLFLFLFLCFFSIFYFLFFFVLSCQMGEESRWWKFHPISCQGLRWSQCMIFDMYSSLILYRNLIFLTDRRHSSSPRQAQFHRWGSESCWCYLFSHRFHSYLFNKVCQCQRGTNLNQISGFNWRRYSHFQGSFSSSFFRVNVFCLDDQNLSLIHQRISGRRKWQLSSSTSRSRKNKKRFLLFIHQFELYFSIYHADTTEIETLCTTD